MLQEITLVPSNKLLGHGHLWNIWWEAAIKEMHDVNPNAMTEYAVAYKSA